MVLGASRDTVEAQEAFARKLDVKFPLLADTEGKLCQAYGVMKEKMMYGKTAVGLARTTFVIGPDTRIRAVFEKVKPEGHPKEVLEVVSAGDDTED